MATNGIKLALAAKMLKTTRPKLVAFLQLQGIYNQHRTPTDQALNDGLFICEIRDICKPNYSGKYPIFLMTPKGFGLVQDKYTKEKENERIKH